MRYMVFPLCEFKVFKSGQLQGECRNGRNHLTFALQVRANPCAT